MPVFEPFPKMARLSRECTITEKIDGTNAQVYIEPNLVNTYDAGLADYKLVVTERGEYFQVYAGSRTRTIKPGKTTDNFGFAQWVWDNAAELVKLGPGRHFGEWWGKGIQRNYGLDEKRFSLFHTHGIDHLPDCASVVPTLYQGPFTTEAVDDVMDLLGLQGSAAAPGFGKPEGIVIFHNAARVLFKKTFDKDQQGKGE